MLYNKNVNPWLSEKAREGLSKVEQFYLLDARFGMKAFEGKVLNYVETVNDQEEDIHIEVIKEGAWKSEDLKGTYREDKPIITIRVKSNILEHKQYDPVVIRLEGHGANSNWRTSEYKLDQRWAVRRNSYSYGEVRKYKAWEKAFALLVNRLEFEVTRAKNDIENKIRFDENDRLWKIKKADFIKDFDLNKEQIESIGPDDCLEARICDNVMLTLQNKYDNEQLKAEKPILKINIEETIHSKEQFDSLLNDIEDLMEKHNIK